MGIIYSVSNFKGGCGKTSTALNLGAALAAAGKSVALIDNDVQSNLTASLGYTPAEQPRTLANLLLSAIDYPEDLDFHLRKTIITRTQASTSSLPTAGCRMLLPGFRSCSSLSTMLLGILIGPANVSCLNC